MAFIDTNKKIYAYDNMPLFDFPESLNSECVVEMMNALNIIGISSVSNSGSITFYSDKEFYDYKKINNQCAAYAFSIHSEKTLPAVLEIIHKLNPDVNPDFYFIKTSHGSIYSEVDEKFETVKDVISLYEFGLETSLSLSEIGIDYPSAKLIYDPERVKNLIMNNGQTFEEFRKYTENHLKFLNNLRSYPPQSKPKSWMMQTYRKDITRPCILANDFNFGLYAYSLPPYFTENTKRNAELLAKFISKKFLAIGKVTEFNAYGTKFRSVFFAYDCEGYLARKDYIPYFPVVINQQKFESCYRMKPETVGNYLSTPYSTHNYDNVDLWEPEEMSLKRDLGKNVKHLEQIQSKRKDLIPPLNSKEYVVNECDSNLRKLKRRRAIFDSYTDEQKKKAKQDDHSGLEELIAAYKRNNWSFKITDEEIREAEKKLEDAKKLPDGILPFNPDTDYSGFISFMCNVPIDLQLEACAIVAGISVEEMKVKLG